MDENYYWLGFSAFPGIGPHKFRLLLKYFDNAKNAWKASNKDLIKTGIGEKLVFKFDRFRNNFSISFYVKSLKSKKVAFLTLKDKNYPKLLSEIKNPPFVLYIKSIGIGAGNMPHISNDAKVTQSKNSKAYSSSLTESRQSMKDKNLKDKSMSTFSSFESGQVSSALLEKNPYSIAVVGTRKITQYGRQVTAFFTRELVAAGFTIISGLAIGVDAVAHKTAIEENGKTIAVLGSGVDLCYPSINKMLYEEIIKSGGAIVSEFPLGQKPFIGSFPSRNRIIAGLSLGVLVTEGAEDSGALITAEEAWKNKRKVFAVPGPITSTLSKGPYKLISKGAKLVTSPQDILDELGIKERNPPSLKLRRARGETKEEQKILDLLQNEPLHFDQIVKNTKLNPAKVGSILSIMELKGFIKNLENGMFSI